MAVARPHHLTWTGEPITLDGSRSWSRTGIIARFDWTFSDGATAVGPMVERTYDRPGEYSETLKITDDRGNIAYDRPPLCQAGRLRGSRRADRSPEISSHRAPLGANRSPWVLAHKKLLDDGRRVGTGFTEPVRQQDGAG